MAMVGLEDGTPVIVDVGVKWSPRGYGRVGRWNTCPVKWLGGMM